MKTFSGYVICEHCDSVHESRPLHPNSSARCLRCQATLYRAHRLSISGWLALTLAAAITFAIANIYPIMTVDLEGLNNAATLWQATLALARSPAWPIALPAAGFLIFVPFAQIAALSWVLIFARAGRRAPGFRLTMRALNALRPWSMVEVGMLGILVSIAKLSDLVSIWPGPGVWATGALVVLLTVITHRDTRELWDLPAHRPAGEPVTRPPASQGRATPNPASPDPAREVRA